MFKGICAIAGFCRNTPRQARRKPYILAAVQRLLAAAIGSAANQSAAAALSA
jgi:hypothetical protein